MIGKPSKMDIEKYVTLKFDNKIFNLFIDFFNFPNWWNSEDLTNEYCVAPLYLDSPRLY